MEEFKNEKNIPRSSLLKKIKNKTLKSQTHVFHLQLVIFIVMPATSKQQGK